MMEKQVVVFTKAVPKKHSVCYQTDEEGVAVKSVYIMRKALGKPVPTKIKVTIEEV